MKDFGNIERANTTIRSNFNVRAAKLENSEAKAKGKLANIQCHWKHIFRIHRQTANPTPKGGIQNQHYEAMAALWEDLSQARHRENGGVPAPHRAEEPQVSQAQGKGIVQLSSCLRWYAKKMNDTRVAMSLPHLAVRTSHWLLLAGQPGQEGFKF